MMSEYNFDFGHQTGWECPRCGRINAPWLPNCSCSNRTITVTWDKTNTPINPKPDAPLTYDDDWWKQYVTGTQTGDVSPNTWKEPSSFCTSDIYNTIESLLKGE